MFLGWRQLLGMLKHSSPMWYFLNWSLSQVAGLAETITFTLWSDLSLCIILLLPWSFHRYYSQVSLPNASSSQHNQREAAGMVDSTFLMGGKNQTLWRPPSIAYQPFQEAPPAIHNFPTSRVRICLPKSSLWHHLSLVKKECMWLHLRVVSSSLMLDMETSNRTNKAPKCKLEAWREVKPLGSCPEGRIVFEPPPAWWGCCSGVLCLDCVPEASQQDGIHPAVNSLITTLLATSFLIPAFLISLMLPGITHQVNSCSHSLASRSAFQRARLGSLYETIGVQWVDEVQNPGTHCYTLNVSSSPKPHAML